MSKATSGEYEQMTKRKPLIPFSWMPGSWGLKGKTREIARAEYELDGMDLDLRLAEIEHRDDKVQLELSENNIKFKHGLIDAYQKQIVDATILHPEPEEFVRAKLDIDLKAGKISEYEYDVAQLGPESDDPEWMLKKLDFNVKHGKMMESEREKLAADIRGEPWVCMPKINWDPEDSSKTFFELDYNDHFVKHLYECGYTGTEEEVVSKWLNDVCLSVAEDLEIPRDTFIADSPKTNSQFKGYE